MKIQIEAHKKKHTFECEYDDLTTEEIIEIITNLLISAGYDYQNIKDELQ
ncbi:hypothetical protein [Flavobacterium sp.]|jgi:hypothetical protein